MMIKYPQTFQRLALLNHNTWMDLRQIASKKRLLASLLNKQSPKYSNNFSTPDLSLYSSGHYLNTPKIGKISSLKNLILHSPLSLSNERNQMENLLEKEANAARLIDPEDVRINLAINSRGYHIRSGISRDVSRLKEDWRSIVEAKAKEVLLISFDHRLKDDKFIDYGTMVYDFGDCVGVIFISTSNVVFFHFWSHSSEVSQGMCTFLSENIFEDKIKNILDEETNTRDITFWGYTGGEYNSYNRKVALRTWENHAIHNYPKAVYEQLERLKNIKSPIEGGKIILMHGIPGSGKTSFLQVLAREWTKWCHTSYITDPENFLGMTGSMLEVLTWDFNSYISSDVSKADAYHLLIIEDADELISEDARRQSGQALSRLLNIGDGLLGQSTNLLICITTNVNIQDLHPAVSRAGRCLAKIEFTSFSKEEATYWLTSHAPEIDHSKALSKPSSDGYTLAELYEILAENKQISHSVPKRLVGQYL